MKKYWKNAKKTGKVREIRQSKKVGTMEDNIVSCKFSIIDHFCGSDGLIQICSHSN